MAEPRLNDRYRVLGRLGSGAEATVFEVEDRDGSRRALKVFAGLDTEARSRLAGEFRRLAGLEHPALVEVHDLEVVTSGAAGLPAGAAFFTAAVVEGVEPCAAVAGAGDRRVEVLLAIADDVAAALQHIHSAGLVHSDIKPGNILVRLEPEPRAVVLDLGLALARGIGAVPRGTPAFMAPEALAGEADPRADLYGLGATLYAACTGRPPHDADHPAALVRAICDQDATPMAAAWLPAPIAELIHRLLARDPALRPSSAAVVRDEIDRLREALGLRRDRPRGGDDRGSILPPILFGFEDCLASLRAAIAGPSADLITLEGPPGAGHRTVLREGLRRHQVAAAAGRAAPLAVLRGSPDAVAADLEIEPDEAGGEAAAALARWVDQVLGAAARRAAVGPLLLILEPAGDERGLALVRAAAAGHPAVHGTDLTVLALIEREPDREPGVLDGPAIARVTLPRLDGAAARDLVASMLGREPRDDWAETLVAACAGLLEPLVEAVRAAAECGIAEDTAPSALIGASTSAAEVLLRRVAALPPARAAVLEALAVHGGEAPAAAIAVTLDRAEGEVHAEADALAAAGLIERDGDLLRLPAPAHAAVLEEALPPARSRALHRRALGWVEARGGDPVAEAIHLAVVGPAARAATRCGNAATLLAARGQLRRALELASCAAERASGAARAGARLQVAELATATGDYSRAQEMAAAAARSRQPEVQRRARLALARALQKSGAHDRAEALLGELAGGGDEEAIGAYARLLVARARYREAIEVAGPLGAAPVERPEGWRARVEAAGLGHLYLGDSEAAEAAFSRLADEAKNPAARSRAAALQGMVAQSRGAVTRAAELYREAAADARAAGELHAAAVYDINRATAYSERGRFGDALEALEGARFELARLGATAELSAVLFNRGIALLALGETEAARRAAAESLAHATRTGQPHMEVYARLLAGDVARRDGDLAAAAAAYGRAVELGQEHGAGRELLLSLCNLAEVGGARDQRDAYQLLEQAAARAATDDDRDRILEARARVSLALGDATPALAEATRGLAERAAGSGRLDQSWRAATLAARLHLACGDQGRAATLAGRAQTGFDTLLAETPEARQAGLRRDPDACALSALGPSTPPTAAPAAADRGEARVRRLLALGRRLNSELRLGPLLDDVIDTVIEMTTAERGFLLLSGPETDGALRVEVARNFDHSALAGEEIGVSRSIAERAARTGEVVLTVDASFDDRFGAAASVAAMRLRSVLAVPLRQKGRVTGTIYVDHRFRRGAFDDEAIELVRELADIAAIAIENARLVEDNQRRQAEIAELNRRLEAEVVEKEAQLASVKARFDPGDRQILRHPYERIVGRSTAMVEMLRVVDRAADTALPVVIYGESGTGKELVARALHEHGPRSGGPFVAVNCGAVPEQLLESELFGHVRGAFTGADRDRRGLFEAADGGTLFLDEIADTGPAMQARLLRALQAGEIRPVGDERARQVDVRILAASNRRLSDLVAEGRFREDLYYRLAVLHIEVPALRDRLEDLPQLTSHILERLAGEGAAPQPTRDAMARLSGYDWPGNVRELENELARAWALSDGTIDLEALSTRVTSAPPPAPRASAPGALRLKARVEQLERQLVEEAMRRTTGNQTAAAKLLGLSRYGLQKKLARYGLSRP